MDEFSICDVGLGVKLNMAGVNNDGNIILSEIRFVLWNGTIERAFRQSTWD